MPKREVVHEHEGKWYYWDGTWTDRMGGYTTKRAAERALSMYCVEALGAIPTPEVAYLLGKAAGIYAYAWYKDGTMYVGTTGTTYARAIDEMLNEEIPGHFRKYNFINFKPEEIRDLIKTMGFKVAAENVNTSQLKSTLIEKTQELKHLEQDAVRTEAQKRQALPRKSER